MTREQRERVEALTLLMVDGELTDDESTELDALLADEDAQKLHGLLLEQEATLRGELDAIDVVDKTIDEVIASERVEKRVIETIKRQQKPSESSTSGAAESKAAASWFRGGYRVAAAAVLLLVVGLGGTGVWIYNWSAPPQEALVFSNNTFEPGTVAKVRALVRNHRTMAPYANTAVRFALIAADGAEMWSANGNTDTAGLVAVDALVPETAPEGDYTLRVVAATPGYTPDISRPVAVRRTHRIYVTSDKPRYQPGQTIHMRALAMTSSGLVPAADRSLTFQIRDAKGNLVLKKAVDTSAHGLASVDLELADQVNTGRYVLSAGIGTTVSERSVTVEHYVLPKFALEVTTKEGHYVPGATLEGTVAATYTFGEPVEDATVAVTFKDARTDVVMVETSASAAEPGRYSFTAAIPARFGELAPSELAIDVAVTDPAGFTNQTRVERMVTRQKLLAAVVVAGGKAVVDVPNRFYVAVRTPDGRPTKTSGKLGGVAFDTDEAGLAEVIFESDRWPARSAILELAGQHRRVGWETSTGIVLHADRAIYDGGATMALQVFATTPDGTVFCDAVQGARTLWSSTATLEEGAAKIAYDIPADVHGPVRLRAFQVGADGGIYKASEIVMVRSRQALSLATSLDREQYRPGESAKLRIAVTREGKAAPAALSLAGVDGAVFAMSEHRPEMQQAYFDLDPALRKPSVAWPPLDRVMALEGDVRERSARAAFSRVAPPEDTVEIDGQGSYFERDWALQDEKATWLIPIALLLCMVPTVVGWLLLLVVMRRLFRAASTKRSVDDGLAPAMRNVLFAWIGALVIPIIPTLIGGIVGRDEGAWLGFAVGVLSAGPLLLMALRELRRVSALRLDMLVVAFLVLAVGAGVLAVGVDQRALDDEHVLLAAAVPGYAIWALTAGFLFAAGRPEKSTTWRVLGATGALFAPVLGLSFFVFWTSHAVDAALPTAGEFSAELPPGTRAKGQGQQLTEPGANPAAPVVRSYFPETLLWQPELITDEHGIVELDVPLADSITTWRVSLSAVAADGALGAAEQGIRVFQPFFIEPNLPIALTQGDLVDVPVAVFNYLDEAQEVTVRLAPAPWFASAGGSSRTVKLAPREVGRVTFNLEALKAGEHRMVFEGSSGDLADAVERTIRVEPNGRRIDRVTSGQLTNTEATQTLAVPIPEDAIAGSEDLVLKIYPNGFSQVAEGMEGVFRMPNGCFEQTSSVTYPSLLVLRYMKASGTVQPELQAKAERFIQMGYQRLLSFEVKGGGFDWFGKGPAHPVLTAYGLMEFTDMARIQPVDPAMVARTQAWLLSQQRADGTWTMASAGVPEGATRGHEGRDRRTTAYIAWALAESGVEDARIGRAMQALAQNPPGEEDAYTLALVANALIAGKHPAASQALDGLVKRASAAEGRAHWTSQAQGLTYGRGNALDVETTALAAYALMRAKRDIPLAHQALTWLVAERDEGGTWRSTQATVAAMRALLAGQGNSQLTGDVAVDIVIDGERAETVRITPETADVFHLVSLRAPVRKGARSVDVQLSGESTVAYQLVTTYYERWPERAASRELAIEQRFSASDVVVGEVVVGEVSLVNNRDEAVDMVMATVTVLPGFSLDVMSLHKLVSGGVIERFERRGAEVDLYVRKVSANNTLKLSYRMVAAQRASIQAPPAVAYLYYEPEVRDATRPVAITVR